MPLDEKWAAFAHSDIFSAEVLLKERVWNQVCFHSQQAVEKLLKGSLPPESRPRTHKIADLIRLTDFLQLDDALKTELRLLDRFYIPSRYPDALPGSIEDGMPTEKDALDSLHAARALASLILAQ